MPAALLRGRSHGSYRSLRAPLRFADLEKAVRDARVAARRAVPCRRICSQSASARTAASIRAWPLSEPARERSNRAAIAGWILRRCVRAPRAPTGAARLRAPRFATCRSSRRRCARRSRRRRPRRAPTPKRPARCRVPARRRPSNAVAARSDTSCQPDRRTRPPTARDGAQRALVRTTRRASPPRTRESLRADGTAASRPSTSVTTSDLSISDDQCIHGRFRRFASIGADALRRLEPAASREDREPAKQRAFAIVEQCVAPLERRR